MVRFIAAAAFAILTNRLHAATLSTTGPAAGLTQLTVDQPHGQFSKIGLPGGPLLDFGVIWTDSPQLRITDLHGVGSLHTFVLSPDVQLIAVRPTYAPDVTTQEFAYEYHVNTPYGLLRQQLGPINLPYGAASADGIPEPASAMLATLGIVALAGIVGRPRGGGDFTPRLPTQSIRTRTSMSRLATRRTLFLAPSPTAPTFPALRANVPIEQCPSIPTNRALGACQSARSQCA